MNDCLKALLRRPYYLVAFVPAVLIGIVVVVLPPVTDWPNMDDAGVQLAITGAFVLIMTWSVYGCPWCESTDVKVPPGSTPRRRCASFAYGCWAWSVLLIGSSIVLAILLLAFPSEAQWWYGWVAVLTAAAGVVTVGFNGWFLRRLDARFRQKCATMRLCFACGYDLREIGSATCPECGELITNADVAQPTSGDGRAGG